MDDATLIYLILVLVGTPIVTLISGALWNISVSSSIEKVAAQIKKSNEHMDVLEARLEALGHLQHLERLEHLKNLEELKNLKD